MRSTGSESKKGGEGSQTRALGAVPDREGELGPTLVTGPNRLAGL